MSSGRHAHKGAIARQILQTVQQRDGNFLRKLDSASERQAFGLSDDTHVWIVVDEETSLLKVKQALREQESSAPKSDADPSTPPRKRSKTSPKTQVAVAPNHAVLSVATVQPGRIPVGTSTMATEPPPSIRLVNQAATLNSAVIAASPSGRPDKSRREKEPFHSYMTPTPPPPDALQLLFQLKHSTPHQREPKL
jgi:hypothetical protein